MALEADPTVQYALSGGKFWKEKLIEYAREKSTGGVLQRHSLAALENFGDEIPVGPPLIMYNSLTAPVFT